MPTVKRPAVTLSKKGAPSVTTSDAREQTRLRAAGYVAAVAYLIDMIAEFQVLFLGALMVEMTDRIICAIEVQSKRAADRSYQL